MTTSARLASGLALLLIAAPALALEPSGVPARVAFDRLKTLAGDWKVSGDHCSPDDPAGGKITYKVAAAGSIVIETFMGGGPNEMVSVYHLDGDDLRMTHYCALGNQPRMKLDRAASTPEKLAFVFDGGTNFDPAKDMHVHSGRIAFLPGNKVAAEWDGYQGGAKLNTSKFELSRP